MTTIETSSAALKDTIMTYRLALGENPSRVEIFAHYNLATRGRGAQPMFICTQSRTFL